MNEIIKLFENKDSQQLIDLYNQDKSKFSSLLSPIFVKQDNLKLLQYLDSLNILEDSATTVLFECLKSTQVKSTQYLNKYLIKDSNEAIMFNRLMIHNGLLNQDNFNKRIKVIPIIINKISDNNFYQILEQSNKGLDELKKQMESIYLYLTVGENNHNQSKKLKI